MKKKIVAMLMASLMMLGATGCSTEGLKLYKEIEKTSTWDYEETKGDMTVSVQAEDETVNLHLLKYHRLNYMLIKAQYISVKLISQTYLLLQDLRFQKVLKR
ncbi:MAG: hypothetical protein K0S30_2519 [Clostridia bacterium]|nr:hypothetical protein [Clostridia bacterium]